MEGGNLRKEQQQLFQELKRIRELSVGILGDNSTFVNLGYTHKQMGDAKHVLAVLEEDLADVEFSPRLEAHFHDDSEARNVFLTKLRNGGFSLTGQFDSFKQAKSDPGSDDPNFTFSPQEFYKFLTSQMNTTPPYSIVEGDTGTVAIIRVLPNIPDLTGDLDNLVKNLYEGTEKDSRRNIRMQGKNKATQALSRVLPIATYRAVWVDERTKLELIVESNFETRGEVAAEYLSQEPTIDIWRRINATSLDQKNMIGFGRKPNVNSKKALESLNTQKEKIVSGQLSFGKSFA